MDWFSPAAHAALGPTPYTLAIASAEEWEVGLLGDRGELHRIIRPSIPRQPATSVARERRREYFEEIAVRIRAQTGSGARLADELPTPDSIPAIGRLFWDRAGNLWAGRREVDPADMEVYEVFDREGHWISSVRFPQRMGHILEIGEDYVLAAWSDELGVAYLRQYRIDK